MLDNPSRPTRPPGGSAAALQAQPRAFGRAAVSVEVRRGESRLAGLRQEGSAKCLLPRIPGPPEAVFLNTAGGVTGGDDFGWTAGAGEGAQLTATTQTAERLYRVQPGTVGRIANRLSLGPGARLDWLPQETIVFDGAGLRRSLEVEMAADATLTALEAIVLGREMMGETVRAADVADRWRIRRGGRLVYADALRLPRAVAGGLAAAPLFGPNRAAATLVHVAPDAGARLAAVRDLLAAASAGAAEAGASARDGVLVVRMVAPTGQALRRALIRFLTDFRGPLPRVWTM